MLAAPVFAGQNVVALTAVEILAKVAAMESARNNRLPSYKVTREYHLQVDARGKFVLEGLAPGEYELMLSPLLRPGGPPGARPQPVRQKVMVGAGETAVTITLDLGEKKEGQQ